MQDFQSGTPNPLKKYFRQSKISISFPSQGNFYPKGSLETTETGQYPVFPMTARDEIVMKTPDSLVNGQATVDVIQSCIPNIKNAWDVPTIDLDVILIGMRIATYGETMDVTIKTPVTGEEKSYSLNLTNLLNDLTSVQYNNRIELDDMIVYIRPLSYRDFTKTSLKTFEEQKIFRTLNNDKLTEDEKLVKFNESFKKLTDITITTLERSIMRIDVDGQIVTDPNHIKEFVDNAEKNFFRTVLDHIDQEKKKFAIKPLTVKSSLEDIEKGVPETFEVPITFDQSNFFE
jgi:hypothetical protein